MQSESWSLPGYRIGPVLGRGGFATVYEAQQESLNRSLAVKVLAVDLVSENDRRRFDRERELLTRLGEHPHVVDLVDAGVSRGRPFLVMRLYRRGTLAARLQEAGPLPLPEVVSTATKLASALDAAHALGVLHRDVKPENVLLTESGEPVLADFGIAAVVDPDGSVTRGQNSTTFFSVSHSAPEVLESATFSVASDVYALASSCYLLLAGRPAFDPRNPRVMTQILDDPIPPLDRPDLPPAVVDVVLRGMSRRPADRPASAGDFARQLAHAAAGAPGSPAFTPGPGPESRTRRAAHAPARTGSTAPTPQDPGRRTGLIGVLAAAVVVPLIAGGVWLAAARTTGDAGTVALPPAGPGTGDPGAQPAAGPATTGASSDPPPSTVTGTPGTAPTGKAGPTPGGRTPGGRTPAAAGPAAGATSRPAVVGNPVIGPGGKCLDVSGDDTGGNGTAVQLWDCQSFAVDQHWTLTGGLLKTLGRCLDVKDFSIANRAVLQLWDCAGAGNQQWVTQADGSIKNVGSGRCIDAPQGRSANGTRLEIFDCLNGVNQKFRYANGASPVIGPAGKCLDVAGDDTPADGVAVQLWDCQPNAKDQQWTWNGTALLTLGWCLDLKNDGIANGTRLQLHNCTGAAAQQWVAWADGTLRNPGSGRCLDAPSATTANGTQLQLYDCNSTSAQVFRKA